MGRRGHGEGALFYEEDRDRWVVLLELPPDGSARRRRRKVTGRTKTDARRKLRQLQRRLEDGLPTGDGSMTLGDFLKHWLAEVLPVRSRVQAKSTVTNYRWAAGHAIKGLGRRRLNELTPENVGRLQFAGRRGLGWWSSADARHPGSVVPGATLVTGNEMATAVVRVVAVDHDGQVHFSILPGSVDENTHLLLGDPD